MSSIEQLQLQQAGDYVELSFFVLYFFESIIAFSQEVKVIWSRKWTVTSWLYMFTRYGSLLFSIATFVPITSSDCTADQHILEALELLQFLCFAVFSSLRVYALLNGQVAIAVIVFLLNIVPFITNFYGFVKTVVVWDVEVCTSTFTLSPSLVLRIFVVTLATRIAVIVADVLVTAVTWYKTARLYNDSRRLNMKAPLASLMLRDGTLYFILLLLFNVFQIIEQQSPILYALSISTSLQEVMTPIIICRFILDLRQVQTTDPATISGNRSTKMRFVGNMGESLQTGMAMEDPGEEYSIPSTEPESESSGMQDSLETPHDASIEELQP